MSDSVADRGEMSIDVGEGPLQSLGELHGMISNCFLSTLFAFQLFNSSLTSFAQIIYVYYLKLCDMYLLYFIVIISNT